MFAQPLKQLPPADIRKILVLRTAPTPQIQWAVEQLKQAYPQARFSILGRQLDHPLFEDMEKMPISAQWLTPRSCRMFRRKVAVAGFDLAVMCLNGDSFTGYENVSRVMKRIPAATKLVSAYTREWYCWRHDLFHDGSPLLRWALNSFESLLLPLIFLAVAAMPSRNTYMPGTQGRPAPGYDR
jgi:hypothetical protein